MERYIPKSVILTEIKRRRDACLMRQKNLESIGQETVLNEMIANELNRIISFIDTIEVKKMDSNDAFIKKACRWIKENITNNPNADSVLVRNGCVTLGMLIEDFKKYMEK